VIHELTRVHGNKNREERFLAFARSDNDCLLEQMRDLALPMFEGFADGVDESWFTWAHQLSSFFS
jgi:hypothetical protein